MTGSYVVDGEVVEEYTLSLLEDGRLFVKIVYNDGNDESDMYMEKTTAKDMEDTMEEVTRICLQIMIRQPKQQKCLALGRVQ